MVSEYIDKSVYSSQKFIKKTSVRVIGVYKKMSVKVIEVESIRIGFNN